MNRTYRTDGTWHRRSGPNGAIAGLLPYSPSRDTGVIAWYDASDSSTITISTGVSEWRDKSGNGNHATQATGANQPTYLTNDFNGLNVVSFNGSTHRLAHTYAQSASNFSIFAVVNANYQTGFRGIYSTAGATTTQSALYSRLSTSNSWGASNSTTERAATNVVMGMGWHIIGFTRTTSGFFYLNANSDGSLSTDCTGQATGHIGGISGQEFSGKIGEIVVWNSSISGTRENPLGYLAHKWGLTRFLGSTFTYKYSIPPQ